MKIFSDFFQKKQPELSTDQKQKVLSDMGQRLKKLVPDEKSIGEPFWGLMEIKGGQSTGNYLVLPNETGVSMPLFISKYHAEAFLAHRPLPDLKLYAVRGLTQEQIRFLSKTAEDTKKVLFMIFLNQEEGTQWKVRQIDGKMLKAEFVWD